MKKRFIFFAALAVVLAIAVTPANAAKPVKPVDIIKGPYLQQLTPNSIVIMWETNTAAGSRVDYWITPEEPYSVEGPTSVKIHEIELSGLAADTPYYYTVTSGGTTSEPNTFATAPATERSFRFVAYGDTRTNASAHAAVIQGIIASEPEFVLHTGDLVSDGDNKNVWGPEFFDPAYDLMIKTPLLPVIGNHEGSGNLFRDFFSLGDNDDWFAFSYSNVRFIGLNTHNRSYSPGSTQYNWLLEELTSDAYTNATWHIVYFHHPPYTATSSHSDTTNVKTYLVPLFEQYGVDMVFNGHSHAYERYFNNGIYYIVTGGGGAPLASLVDDDDPPISEYAESVYHHCVIDVDVEGESLTLSARYNNGVEFDTITLPPVDVTAPTANLIAPLDNGPDDLDADDGEVTVNTTQPLFDIQLSDVGDGIDYDTVISAAVVLTKGEGEDKVLLTEPADYSFSGTGSDVITLTPAVSPFGNGLYVITLSGIADVAGNEMAVTTLTILIDTSIVPPVTLSFQQGVDGYSGTVDTMLQEDSPDTNNAGAASLNVDSDEPFGTGRDIQVLVRFEDIFGSGPGQMPLEAQILSATLELEVTNLGHSFHLHEMLQSWSETATWNSMVDGIQADGGEAAATPAATTGPVGTGALSIDVTSSISAWRADPSANHGWVMLPTGADGVDFDSSEGTTPPKLIVTFLPGPDTTPPTLDSVLATSETTVAVVFSEPVEQSSAQTVANYVIDQGVTISSAVLQADTRTVVLAVSVLSEGVTYTLTVNDVIDCASTPNPIVAGTQETFEYVSNLPVAYWALDDGSGTTAVDSSGNGNDGTLKNGAAFTEFGIYAGAVIFDGADDYIQVESSVTPPPLGLPTFTLAAWFKRTGAGDTVNTGTGGFYGEPLVTKGRGEEDGDNRDMNYFLGLTQSGGNWVLGADFEEHNNGQNYPVFGSTAISDGQWHHAAATYDGSQWNLYLDGIPDGTSVVNKMPNYESIQFAAIGGALNSTGARDGAFNGTIDEVFIFAGALSQQEIINLMGNLPPVANAGADQTVSDGESVTLDGSGSSDPDGTIVSYEWDIDGDQITDYTGETVLDVPLGVGIHTVTLTVEDNEGATDSDDVVITVNPAPDTVPPTPNPMTWATVPYATGSTSISMTATTATDESGVEYYFTCTAGGGNDSGWQDSPTYEDTGLSPNTEYNYTVKAHDKSAQQNETAASTPASATTDVLSLPGQATEPNPADGQTGVNKNTVILNWTAGAGATSHDVYLGTDETAVISADKDSAEFKGNQTQTTYDPPKLGRKTMYYWRIDEVNAAGTTTGVVWSFTTN